MPEFTEFPIPRKDVSELNAGEQQNVREGVGLGNVDNTSDADKPISSATQTALDLKADAESALPRRITTSMISAIKTVVETPAQAFAGGSALASRRSLILRNESTSTRIRYGRQSANLQRDGEIIEPQAVVALQLEPGTATAVFACSEGASAAMHIVEDIG